MRTAIGRKVPFAPLWRCGNPGDPQGDPGTRFATLISSSLPQYLDIPGVVGMNELTASFLIPRIGAVAVNPVLALIFIAESRPTLVWGTKRDGEPLSIRRNLRMGVSIEPFSNVERMDRNSSLVRVAGRISSE